MPIQIYIVEDHQVMRDALAEFISNEAPYEVWGTAGSAEQALEDLTEEGEVDLVFVDTRLPEMDGIQLVEELLARRPELKCLMLSGHDEETYVEKALEAGAKGYLVKGNPDEINAAIQRVLDGNNYLSDQLRGRDTLEDNP